METHNKTSAKDFFINLGAIVALYTTVVSLVNLLFTVINTAYPQITNGYTYFGSTSISWPVATLIIFFPIFILLMWLLEKEYKKSPEKQNSGVHRWLTYITLFIAGIAIAIDLITVLYFFIDGQELTTSFLLKVLVLFVIAIGVFTYYLMDVRGRLTPQKRNIYRVISLVIIIGSIVWGFMVLGSPATQRLYKYDEQKVNDLMNINQSVISYYQMHSSIPGSLSDLTKDDNYFVVPMDPQSGKPYEYVLIGQSAKAYNLCAEFNKASNDQTKGGVALTYPYDTKGSWNHPAGHYCFAKSIDLSLYKPVPVR